MFIIIYKSNVVSVCISKTKVSRNRHNLIIFGSSMKQQNSWGWGSDKLNQILRKNPVSIKK